jgi:hypothetical protein
MKHLLTISALLISSLAMGQWPSLPYNPDDNADGLIGVADLQALLANYGNEFASAVVSEDGESAIVYMGELGYPQCKYSCDHLPGFWFLPEVEDLVPVWDEVVNNSSEQNTWLKPLEYRNSSTNPPINATYPTPLIYRYLNSGEDEFYNQWLKALDNSEYRCYCAAKQLPRVEYSACEGSNIQDCCASKVSEGWYPLGNPTSAPQNNSPYYRWNQSFWRWAE